jgi:hypothetical protein
MKPRRSVRVGILAAAVLAGAGLLGADFSRPDPATFGLGKTTEQEIRQRFGEPHARASAQVGDKQVVILRYAHAEAGSALIPTRALVYLFHEGRLVGFDYSSSFAADQTVFDESSATRIKRGETTRAEVVGLVGTPTGQFIYPSPYAATPGRHAVIYSYSRSERIPAGGTLESTNKVLAVVFDERDVVIETSLVITSTRKPLQ